MLTLTLIRHGQTVENLEGILQGQSEGHLNQAGILQIQTLRDSINKEDYDIILCSDLERTKRTALILNEKLQLPIHYTELLRERDWGEYTGRHIREIIMPPSEFPPSVENPRQLADRAHLFLQFLFDNYDNRRILAVGHGYFNRCIQAVIQQTSVRNTLRWSNTEMRTFQITTEVLKHSGPTDYIVSEN